MMNDGIEILEHNGEGFSKVVCFGAWRVAMINYSERFEEKNLNLLERHMLTDEVFVLLEGKAILVSDKKRYEMEKNKLYNVKKEVWHAIALSKDAKVLIVENIETGKENSEYKIKCSNYEDLIFIIENLTYFN